MAQVEEMSHAMKVIKRYIEDELRSKKITKNFTPYYEANGFLYPFSDNLRIKIYMDDTWGFNKPEIMVEQYKDEKWSTAYLPNRIFKDALNHFDEIIDEVEVIEFKEKRKEKFNTQKELFRQVKFDDIKEQSIEYDDYKYERER